MKSRRLRCGLLPEQQALSDAIDSHDEEDLVSLGCANVRRLSAGLWNPH